MTAWRIRVDYLENCHCMAVPLGHYILLKYLTA